MGSAIERYRELRRATDGVVATLEQLHCRHMACKAGCHQCCVNLTVFPVEYYAILEELGSRGVKEMALDERAACAFLGAGLCTIYRFRPMICRTHGLPVAFVNEEADEAERSVSFCPLNFTQAEDEELAFGPASTLDVDGLNRELYAANEQFIEEHPELHLAPGDRIPLRRLAADL